MATSDRSRFRRKPQSRFSVAAYNAALHFLARPKQCRLTDAEGADPVLHWLVARDDSHCATTIRNGTQRRGGVAAAVRMELCTSLSDSWFPQRTLRVKLVTRFGNSEDIMAKLMSKSELVQKIAEQHPNNMTRKDVKSVIESLAEIGYKELKKTGAFFVPGFAKFVVIKKPATKARKGINPFTKEPTIFKAKPARKIVRARPVKAAKDAVS